jgi:LysR family transcriptional regulator, hca operon transcriptional activator
MTRVVRTGGRIGAVAGQEFVRNFLTLSLVARLLAGEAPSIDLVLGYHKANNAPLLKTFLSRVDDMIGHVAKSSGKS